MSDQASERSGSTKNKKSKSKPSTSCRSVSPVYDYNTVQPQSPVAEPANVNNVTNNNAQYDARFNKIESSIANLDATLAQ